MSEKDQTVSNTEQAAMLSRLEGEDLRLGLYDDFMAAEERSPGFAAGLVSLAFIRAAIRRSRLTWCATALIGLLIGLGIYVVYPPAYKASASVLLTFGPYENATTAAIDDEVIGQSNPVAALALHRLGLAENASQFAATYTVSVVSDRVLLITVSAPSSTAAVSRANAVAVAFLQFRARQLQTEQTLVLNSLTQQVAQAKQKLASISKQISQLPAQPSSPAQQAQLSRLRAKRDQSASTLYPLEQSASGSQAKAATALAIRGSQVLDAATPVASSRLKRMLLYPAVGLVLGLALGIGVVVVRAVCSDRPRRREEVAQALGAPVAISVGAAGLNWRRARRTGAAADRGAAVQRIVAHLRSVMPPGSRGTAALAVVPADEPQLAALAVRSLAISLAEQGKQVVVADLCSAAPAAQLLGAQNPGVHHVNVDGTKLVAAVPDKDDVAPVGPASRSAAHDQRSAFTEAVAAACAQADVLLTLAGLDASIGGAHLATWATDAVVIVTAGRSSWTRIHAVGEMTRLAGVRLVSAVLAGADRTDESLGVAPSPAGPAASVTWS